MSGLVSRFVRGCRYILHIPAKAVIALIRLYQKYISPGLPRRCKYQPTCSQYAIESIKTHGLFKGTILTSWRILRCNPWSAGGVDWVPERGQWPKKPLGYTELMKYRAETESALHAHNQTASTKTDGDAANQILDHE